MIKPFQKNEVLVADIEAFKTNTGFKIWWLGQSGFLIKWQQKTILFDPYLSDSLTKKYAQTDKPHTRMSELAVQPQNLPKIDIVTSSHNHTDHLDAETLLPILQKNKEIKFIIPEANRSFITERLNCDLNFPIGLNEAQSIEYQGFKITGIASAHNTVERNEKGECKFMGYIVQFGPFAVYHSGDTLWWNGLENILKPYKVDVAFLPINGNKPERKVAGNLNPTEAAELAKTINAKMVIPHHYHLFEFNTEDPQQFEKACQKINVNFEILEIGQSWEQI
jgi:L-ascorbate metabolism protein UlaG (beta-lactamase superfamily)